LDYLRDGDPVQQSAFHCLTEWRIIQDLASYKPILCGTVPLGISLPDSDLDIICEVADLPSFEGHLTRHFAHLPDFSLSYDSTSTGPALTVVFQTPCFSIEIFGQAIPVKDQHAYRHMLQEARILAYGNTAFRKGIIHLKQKGLSTEEAFARQLGLDGDPYEALLRLENVTDEALAQLVLR